MAIRRKRIEDAVNNLISENSIISPPVNLFKIAESLNIEIISKPSEDDLSGFLFRDFAKNQTIIGVNQNHHPNRRRFTIAHEIGHFILHNYEGFHFDSSNENYLLKLRKKNSRVTNKEEEREADIFAAQLLMPKEFVIRDVLTLESPDLLFDDNIPKLARKYKVSVRAFTIRLENLGYIVF